MRTLSADFLSALYDPETDEAIVVLLTFYHSSLPNGVLRVSSHNTTRFSSDPLRYGTISRGNAFEFFPFSIALPEEGDDVEPAMQITLDNVTREVTPLLSQVTEPISVLVEIVTASDPDDVEVPFPDFEITSAEIDSGRVVLSLTLDALTSEPYPGYDFTPGAFPSLWAET